MRAKNLVDNLLLATGNPDPDAVSAPYETEAMVYVGDIYALLVGASGGADPHTAAASLGNASVSDPDTIWPFIR
jgi:hypothetical protein